MPELEPLTGVCVITAPSQCARTTKRSGLTLTNAGAHNLTALAGALAVLNTNYKHFRNMLIGCFR